MAARTKALREGHIGGFERLQKRTECVFARGTRVRFAPPWDPQRTFAANITAAARKFAEFIDDPQAADAFVIGIGASNRGDNIARLTRTVKSVFAALRRHERTSATRSVATPESEYWRCSFRGMDFYVLVFAPCYSAESSRYAHGSEHVYFLFQTVSSFERRHKESTHIAQTLRHEIRSAYAAAGRPYDIAISTSRYEALKIVKPLHIGVRPIKWWL